MSSSAFFPSGLKNWAPDDKPQRADFVSDNEILDKAIRNMPLTVYPVGAIYMSVNPQNPGDIFGGTWVAWGKGRVPVGVNTADTDFSAVEKTGGAKAVALAEPQLPVVNAPIKYNFSQNMTMVGGSEPGFNLVYQDGTNPNTTVTANFGGGLPHNNLQPYITCYMWKRTA